jgi:hypothetical protein
MPNPPKSPSVPQPNPLDIIEAAANFAGLAASFRDALLAEGFHETPAEHTALQVAAGIMAQAPR